MRRPLTLVLVLAGCAEPGGAIAFDCPGCDDGGPATTKPGDPDTDAGNTAKDAGAKDSGGGGGDGSTSSDAATDAYVAADAKADSPVVVGPITGGPCLSGQAGATAFRVRWVNGGGRATVQYETHGLPDKSRWKASV